MKYLLIVFMFILAFLGILKEFIGESKPTRIKIVLLLILILLIIIVFVLQIIDEYNTSKKLKYAGQYGKLESPIKSDSSKAILSIGGADLDANFYFSDDTELSVKMKDRKAVITTQIRDKDGSIIGKIIDNEWFVVSNPSVVLDKNFNNNSLEILNSKGDVIFQVRIIGNRVQIAGYFFRKDGSNAITLLPWLHESDKIDKTLFKYPSSKYQGILNKVIN
jgi:hypothetical protein